MKPLCIDHEQAIAAAKAQGRAEALEEVIGELNALRDVRGFRGARIDKATEAIRALSQKDLKERDPEAS